MKTTLQAVIQIDVKHENATGLEKAIERIERDGAHLNVSSWVEGIYFSVIARPGAKVTSTKPKG